MNDPDDFERVAYAVIFALVCFTVWYLLVQVLRLAWSAL